METLTGSGSTGLLLLEGRMWQHLEIWQLQNTANLPA